MLGRAIDSHVLLKVLVFVITASPPPFFFSLAVDNILQCDVVCLVCKMVICTKDNVMVLGAAGAKRKFCSFLRSTFYVPVALI